MKSGFISEVIRWLALSSFGDELTTRGGEGVTNPLMFSTIKWTGQNAAPLMFANVSAMLLHEAFCFLVFPHYHLAYFVSQSAPGLSYICSLHVIFYVRPLYKYELLTMMDNISFFLGRNYSNIQPFQCLPSFVRLNIYMKSQCYVCYVQLWDWICKTSWIKAY